MSSPGNLLYRYKYVRICMFIIVMNKTNKALLSECHHSSIEEVLANEVVEVEAPSSVAVIHLTGGTLAVELVVLTATLLLLWLECV